MSHEDEIDARAYPPVRNDRETYPETSVELVAEPAFTHDEQVRIQAMALAIQLEVTCPGSFSAVSVIGGADAIEAYIAGRLEFTEPTERGFRTPNGRTDQA